MQKSGSAGELVSRVRKKKWRLTLNATKRDKGAKLKN